MTTAKRVNDGDIAARWVARMDAGDWQAGDEQELQTWLSADPARHGLLLRTQAAWLLPEAADAIRQDDDIVAAKPSSWHRRAIIGGLVAASGAAIIAARLSFADSVAYATKLGEIRRVPLADGSVMTINSETELKVLLAKDLRQIDLAQGEAWFEVAKDASRPFVVTSGKVRAKAVGTAFSVRTREMGVEVLVTEGVVETWSDANSTKKIRVRAGERAMVSERAVVHYESHEVSSVDRALAWRAGMIDLNGTTLREAADEFNRYNQRQIVISNPDVAAEQFDGLFRIDDPESFVDAVKSALNVDIVRSDPRLLRIEASIDSDQKLIPKPAKDFHGNDLY